MRIRSNALILFSCLASCVSVARITDLPGDLNEVRFGDVQFNGRWEEEHEFELDQVTDEAFFAATRPALTPNGFKIVRFDPDARVVQASRGMRAQEWASVVGVYRQPISEGGRVKIFYKVTQDFTGSLVDRQYAKNIANRILRYLEWHASGEVPFGEEKH